MIGNSDYSDYSGIAGSKGTTKQLILPSGSGRQVSPAKAPTGVTPRYSQLPTTPGPSWRSNSPLGSNDAWLMAVPDRFQVILGALAATTHAAATLRALIFVLGCCPSN